MKNNICKCSVKSRRLLLLILSAIYFAASVVSLLIAFSEDAFLHFIGDRLYIILYLLFIPLFRYITGKKYKNTV